MHIEAIDHFDGLRTLQDQWNGLSGGVPFRRFEWLGNWWRHYGGETTSTPARRWLLVLLVYESSARRHLLGIAPWFVEQDRIKGRTIRFLGSGEVCSDYMSILCEPGYEKPLAAALATWLHQREADLWDSVELSSFAHDDPLVTELVERLQRAGHAALTWTDCRCWRIPLPRKWGEFESRLSKSHRKQLRRFERRMFDTGRAKLKTVRLADDAVAAFQTLVDLHQHRRKSLDDRGCFDSPQFHGFLSDATRDLFEAGVLRLDLLEVDGRVIAADYNLVSGGVLYAYQSGIDPNQLKMEPGNLLTMAVIRRAIDEGLEGYDWLRGDEAYKLHWRAEPRGMTAVRIFGLSRAAHGRQLLWLARRKICHLARQAIRHRVTRKSIVPEHKIRADTAQHSTQQVPTLTDSGLAVRVITSPTEMAALESTWNHLSGDIIFRQFEWLDSWWNQFGKRSDGSSRRKLFVVSIENETDELVGLAPWYLEHTARQGRVIRFLGSGIACSDYLSILHRDGYRQLVASALSEWLTGPQRPPWERLELTGIAAADPMMSELADQFQRRGVPVHKSPGANCWRTQLPTTWDDCVAMLPKSMRTKVRKCQKRYFDTGRANMIMATSAAEFATGFEIFASLHQKRRTSAGDPGCFSDPVFAAFFREMAERLFARGQLELSWIELDGRPIASSFNLLGDNTSYFYQSGIEPEALEFSPGHMMHMACIKTAIARGDVAYDFLRGDEPYKKLWAAQPVPAVEYRIIANQFRAVVRHLAWLESWRVRRTAKRGLDKIRQWQQAALAAFKKIFQTRAGRSIGGKGA